MDFNNAVYLKKGKEMRGAIGVPYYLSPEMLKGWYDHRTDIWNMGVMTYIMLKGHYPFRGKNSEEIMQNIKNLNIDLDSDPSLSSEAKDLLKKILQKHPSKRIKLEELTKHPFFSEPVEDKINVMGENAELAWQNMKKFYFKNPVQMTMFLFVARNVIDRNGYTWVRNLFQEIDLKSDGKISKNDLTKFYKETGNPKSGSEISEVFKNIDITGKGQIEYEEFLIAVIPKDDIVNEKVIEKFFDFFDEDKTGQIQL